MAPPIDLEGVIDDSLRFISIHSTRCGLSFAALSDYVLWVAIPSRPLLRYRFPECFGAGCSVVRPSNKGPTEGELIREEEEGEVTGSINCLDPDSKVIKESLLPVLIEVVSRSDKVSVLLPSGGNASTKQCKTHQQLLSPQSSHSPANSKKRKGDSSQKQIMVKAEIDINHIRISSSSEKSSKQTLFDSLEKLRSVLIKITYDDLYNIFQYRVIPTTYWQRSVLGISHMTLQPCHDLIIQYLCETRGTGLSLKDLYNKLPTAIRGRALVVLEKEYHIVKEVGIMSYSSFSSEQRIFLSLLTPQKMMWDATEAGLRGPFPWEYYHTQLKCSDSRKQIYGFLWSSLNFDDSLWAKNLSSYHFFQKEGLGGSSPLVKPLTRPFPLFLCFSDCEFSVLSTLRAAHGCRMFGTELTKKCLIPLFQMAATLRGPFALSSTRDPFHDPAASGTEYALMTPTLNTKVRERFFVACARFGIITLTLPIPTKKTAIAGRRRFGVGNQRKKVSEGKKEREGGEDSREWEDNHHLDDAHEEDGDETGDVPDLPEQFFDSIKLEMVAATCISRAVCMFGNDSFLKVYYSQRGGILFTDETRARLEHRPADLREYYYTSLARQALATGVAVPLSSVIPSRLQKIVASRLLDGVALLDPRLSYTRYRSLGCKERILMLEGPQAGAEAQELMAQLGLKRQRSEQESEEDDEDKPGKLKKRKENSGKCSVGGGRDLRTEVTVRSAPDCTEQWVLEMLEGSPFCRTEEGENGHSVKKKVIAVEHLLTYMSRKCLMRVVIKLCSDPYPVLKKCAVRSANNRMYGLLYYTKDKFTAEELNQLADEISVHQLHKDKLSLKAVAFHTTDELTSVFEDAKVSSSVMKQNTRVCGKPVLLMEEKGETYGANTTSSFVRCKGNWRDPQILLNEGKLTVSVFSPRTVSRENATLYSRQYYFALNGLDLVEGRRLMRMHMELIHQSIVAMKEILPRIPLLAQNPLSRHCNSQASLERTLSDSHQHEVTPPSYVPNSHSFFLNAGEILSHMPLSVYCTCIGFDTTLASYYNSNEDIEWATSLIRQPGDLFAFIIDTGLQRFKALLLGLAKKRLISLEREINKMTEAEGDNGGSVLDSLTTLTPKSLASLTIQIKWGGIIDLQEFSEKLCGLPRPRVGGGIRDEESYADVTDAVTHSIFNRNIRGKEHNIIGEEDKITTMAEMRAVSVKRFIDISNSAMVKIVKLWHSQFNRHLQEVRMSSKLSCLFTDMQQALKKTAWTAISKATKAGLTTTSHVSSLSFPENDNEEEVHALQQQQSMKMVNQNQQKQDPKHEEAQSSHQRRQLLFTLLLRWWSYYRSFPSISQCFVLARVYRVDVTTIVNHFYIVRGIGDLLSQHRGGRTRFRNRVTPHSKAGMQAMRMTEEGKLASGFVFNDTLHSLLQEGSLAEAVARTHCQLNGATVYDSAFLDNLLRLAFERGATHGTLFYVYSTLDIMARALYSSSAIVKSFSGRVAEELGATWGMNSWNQNLSPCERGGGGDRLPQLVMSLVRNYEFERLREFKTPENGLEGLVSRPDPMFFYCVLAPLFTSLVNASLVCRYPCAIISPSTFFLRFIERALPSSRLKAAIEWAKMLILSDSVHYDASIAVKIMGRFTKAEQAAVTALPFPKGAVDFLTNKQWDASGGNAVGTGPTERRRQAMTAARRYGLALQFKHSRPLLPFHYTLDCFIQPPSSDNLAIQAIRPLRVHSHSPFSRKREDGVTLMTINESGKKRRAAAVMHAAAWQILHLTTVVASGEDFAYTPSPIGTNTRMTTMSKSGTSSAIDASNKTMMINYFDLNCTQNNFLSAHFSTPPDSQLLHEAVEMDAYRQRVLVPHVEVTTGLRSDAIYSQFIPSSNSVIFEEIVSHTTADMINKDLSGYANGRMQQTISNTKQQQSEENFDKNETQHPLEKSFSSVSVGRNEPSTKTVTVPVSTKSYQPARMLPLLSDMHYHANEWLLKTPSFPSSRSSTHVPGPFEELQLPSFFSDHDIPLSPHDVASSQFSLSIFRHIDGTPHLFLIRAAVSKVFDVILCRPGITHNDLVRRIKETSDGILEGHHVKFITQYLERGLYVEKRRQTPVVQASNGMYDEGSPLGGEEGKLRARRGWREGETPQESEDSKFDSENDNNNVAYFPTYMNCIRPFDNMWTPYPALEIC